MPRVTVTTDPPSGAPLRTLLDETVDPGQLDSDPAAAAFIQRLGWAIADADDDEREVSVPGPRA